MTTLKQFLEGKNAPQSVSVKGTFIFDGVGSDSVNDKNVEIDLTFNTTAKGKLKSIEVSLVSKKYANFRGINRSIGTQISGKNNIQGFFKSGRVMALGMSNNEFNMKKGIVGTYWLVVDKTELAKIAKEFQV